MTHWSESYKPGERCGACCDAEHSKCVVVVEMEARRPNGSPNPKVTGPYPWTCKCQEPNCVKPSVCVDCLRRGVEVQDWRCVDRSRCRNAREYLLKKDRGVPRKPGSGTRKRKEDAA